MKIVKKSLTALAVSALMLGTVSAGTLILSTEVVYAKGNDKNDDRGNSGNNGRSDKGNNNKGGSSNSKNASNKSTSGQGGGFFGLFKKKNKQPTQQTASVAPTTTVPTAKPAKAVNRGALASELKGLNAAHANPNALKNASPDSMVGKVAAYKLAVENEALRGPLEDSLAALNQQLTELTEGYEGRDSETIQGEIDELNRLINDPETDPELIAGYQETLSERQTELAAAQEYESAVSGLTTEIASVETQIEELGPTPEEALDTATRGQDLSPEALAELHNLLGPDAPADDPAENPEEDLAEGTDTTSDGDDTAVVQ